MSKGEFDVTPPVSGLRPSTTSPTGEAFSASHANLEGRLLAELFYPFIINP